MVSWIYAGVGFADGSAWEPMFQSETYRGYIGPMAVQKMSEKEVREADAEEGEKGNLYNMWKNGIDMIPHAVIAIDHFTSLCWFLYNMKKLNIALSGDFL